MSYLQVFAVGSKVLAKTHIAPLPGRTILPGMKGDIIECDEISRRHKVRFENGRELWATSDQIKLDPAYTPSEEPQTVDEPSE